MTQTSHCIAGSVTAGCFSTILGHPLDTIKVHQQTKKPFVRASAIQVARSLAKNKPGRLFKGIGPPMVNQIVMNSVMFSVFNQVKEKGKEHLNPTSAALFGGLFAGVTAACLSTPTDWIKIQVQISISGNGERKNSTTALSILKREALKGGTFHFQNMTRTLYRGHLANLGREGVFTMVYLGLYDRISQIAKDSNNALSLDTPTVVLISSLTGGCAWLCNYPFDTIKTIIQSKAGKERITTSFAIRSLYELGGLKAFFRGAGSSTVRAMLVTSSRMLAYEKTLQMLD
jgi:hypothetical protein